MAVMMRKIEVGEAEVTMDPSILEFGETNLNEFLQKVGVHHAYFAEKHADAMWILGIYEQKYDEIYGKRFRELKQGSSVSIPLAEAATKSDPDVMSVNESVLGARRNKDLLGGFLKSIDKAFQAAMNYGYNRRKEMDKLHHDIGFSGNSDGVSGNKEEGPNERMAEFLAIQEN